MPHTAEQTTRETLLGMGIGNAQHPPFCWAWDLVPMCHCDRVSMGNSSCLRGMPRMLYAAALLRLRNDSQCRYAMHRLLNQDPSPTIVWQTLQRGTNKCVLFKDGKAFVGDLTKEPFTSALKDASTW